jgi:LysM repeat protein
MGSIRPLVTITIIIVVGVYLYVKINEGPVRPVASTAESWKSEADVPPLDSTAAAPATTGAMAPSWPANASATPTAELGSNTLGPSGVTSTQLSPPTADVATVAQTLPAVPAIPELPALPSTTDTSPAAATPSASIPATLPASIPTAQYPGEPATPVAAASNDPYGSQASSASTTPSDVTSNTIPEAAAPVTSQLPSAPSALSGSPLSQNPLRQPAPSAAPLDPYAPAAFTPAPSAAAADTAVQTSFASSWPEIQSKLQRGELAGAHQLLSKWYEESSLTPPQAEMVETLLGQLAGTVVYSTEHQLKPAHVVKPGETLETIAKEHNVPWQLLAKINGIAAADQLQPGQELKVVPGPFSAVVDLRRNQLTLMVDGRYAGKFPVTVPTGAAVTEGEWLVDQKLAAPSSSVAPTSFTAAPAAAERTIVLRGDPGIGQPSNGPTLTIASGTSSNGASAASPAIQVSPADAEDLSDILSIGSRVVIRR